MCVLGKVASLLALIQGLPPSTRISYDLNFIVPTGSLEKRKASCILVRIPFCLFFTARSSTPNISCFLNFLDEKLLSKLLVSFISPVIRSWVYCKYFHWCRKNYWFISSHSRAVIIDYWGFTNTNIYVWHTVLIYRWSGEWEKSTKPYFAFIIILNIYIATSFNLNRNVIRNEDTHTQCRKVEIALEVFSYYVQVIFI